jgi:hypothetical protein
MSPEQAGGGTAADTRSDVYALGAVLFWLLTGRFPFDPDGAGLSRAEVLHRIRTDDPPRPSVIVRRWGAPAGLHSSRLAAHLAHELDWVVLRALDRDPDRRYGSASELAADVERFLRAEPLLASRPGFGYRLRRAARRNRVAVSVGAVVFLALGIGLGSLAVGLRTRLGAARATRVQLYESLLGLARDATAPLAIGQRERLLSGMEQAAALHGGLGRPPGELRVLRRAAMMALVQPDVRILAEWEGFPPGSRGFDVNRDLTRYARGDERGEVVVREVGTDREVVRLAGTGMSAWHIQFAPDGEHLLVVYSDLHVSTPAREFRLWHLPSRTARVTAAGWVDSKAFRHDGRKFVASLPDGSLVVYRTASGIEDRRLPPQGDRRRRTARFLGGTDSLLIWVPGDSGFRVERGWVRFPGDVWEIDTDPHGRHVAVGGTDRLSLLDRATTQAWLEIAGPWSRSSVIAFRPGGDLVATSSRDAYARVREVYTGRELVRLPGTVVGFDRHGERLVYRVGARVVVVEWKDSDLARTIAPRSAASRPNTLAVHPRSDLALSVGGGRVRLWNLGTAASASDIQQDGEAHEDAGSEHRGSRHPDWR